MLGARNSKCRSFHKLVIGGISVVRWIFALCVCECVRADMYVGWWVGTREGTN